MKASLPLAGLQIVELTHVVAGPTAGVILADLGADVVKIEHPRGGDTSRNLHNDGATFFPLNRNKKSVALDLGTVSGREVFRRLVEHSDAVVDNLAPGALDRLGLSYEWARQVNPAVIYLSIKGFLEGRNENRPLLDELAQMMGGLAYLTGFPDQPLRAGASVIDMGAAAFGVVGMLAALYRRQQTGVGEHVRAGLFETTVFFMTSHVAVAQLSGREPEPRAGRESGMGNFMGWGVYQLFATRGGRRLFIAVTSNSQWRAICDVLRLDGWATDPRYDSNRKRSARRKEIAEGVAAAVREWEMDDLITRLEEADIPFAPVSSPSALLGDQHLNEANYWHTLDVATSHGLRVPTLPITMRHTDDFSVRSIPPRLGEHTDLLLKQLGYSDEDLAAMKEKGVARATDQVLHIDATPDVAVDPGVRP